VAWDCRELQVWQEAMDLAGAVYAATKAFPPEERFGLTGCIAEGNARGSTRDYSRFLSMSSGSLAEVETQLLRSRRFGYLSEEAMSTLLPPPHRLARKLQALKKTLSSKLSANHPFPVPRSRFPSP